MRRGCRAYVEITRSSTGVNYSSSSTSKEATFSLHLRHASLIRALRIIDKPYLTFFPTIARAYTRKPASYRFERLPIKTYVIIIRLSRSTVFSLFDFDFISQLFLAFLSLSLEIYGEIQGIRIRRGKSGIILILFFNFRCILYFLNLNWISFESKLRINKILKIGYLNKLK